jgi:hypothetical protein
VARLRPGSGNTRTQDHGRSPSSRTPDNCTCHALSVRPARHTRIRQWLVIAPVCVVRAATAHLRCPLADASAEGANETGRHGSVTRGVAHVSKIAPSYHRERSP